MADACATVYQSRLGSAQAALTDVNSGENISMGMALGEPPALLQALARRIDQNGLSDLKLWYFHSMPEAAQTVLKKLPKPRLPARFLKISTCQARAVFL